MAELKINKQTKKNTKTSQFAFLNKLKGIKNFEVVVAVVVCAIILLIYFAGGSTSKTQTLELQDYTTSVSYAKYLEDKLSKTLSSISGAGGVWVMVTLESGPELVIATSIDQKTNKVESGENKTESITVVENPIIVTQNGVSRPLILMEILPKVKGVIIVSQGAKDIRVRLDLLNAVQALLDISSSNIQIFVGN